MPRRQGKQPDPFRNDMLTALLAAAIDCIIAMDEAGLVCEFNPAAERTFGYTRDEVLGRTLGELIVPPAHRARHEAGLRRLVQSGKSRVVGQRLELEGMRKDGSVFPIELAITELKGNPRGRMFVAYLRDITDWRMADAALRDSEAKLTAFIDSAPISVHIRNLDGRYLLANPQTAKLFKRPLSEIVGAYPADILPPAMVANAEARLAEVKRTGHVVVDEERQVDLDPCFWLRTIRAPLRDSSGEIFAIGTFDIDITERKHAERKMKRQQEALHQNEKLAALGSLLAGVAHELNNPLSIVLGRAIILEEEVDDPDVRQSLSALRVAAERCARIVRTFLSMARQKPRTRRTLNVETQLEAALEMMRYALQTHDIEIVRRWAAGPAGLVDADEDALHQVSLNLLINAQQALEARPPPRQLYLETSLHQEWLEVVVADNGPGVPETIRPQVFDPFFTTKPEGAGSGIGLSVCHSIITAHGGSILVDDRQGGGARFTIRLPLAQGPELQQPRVETQRMPLRGHILVIDDEAEVARLVGKILEREGCTVVTAASGSEGDQALDGQRFDLVITDLHMADRDGHSVLRRLAKMADDVRPPAIVLTGDILAGQRLTLGGEVTVLEKPIEPAILRQTAALLLEQRVLNGDGQSISPRRVTKM